MRFARLLLVLVLVVSGLAGGCAALDEWQRKAVFRPTNTIPDSFTGLEPGDSTYFVPVGNPAAQDQRVQIWWMPAHVERAPTLLYLHGTFRDLYYNYPKMLAIRDAGFSVLGVEYRGWGESTQLVPSEESIYADAELGWRELVRRQPDPKLRVIYGHSLGGAVAVDLAAKKADPAGYGGLIVESTFTSALDLAAATSIFAAPFAWLGGWGFDAQAKIAAVRAPVLVLHGTDDDTVPVGLGRRLFDAAPEPKAFVGFEGGSHSDLHEEASARYRAVLAEFAERMRASP